MDSSLIVLRTWSERARALEPGDWKMGIATAALLSRRLRREYWFAPSSMRAMSASLTLAPLGEVLTTTSPNSDSSTSRPRALMLSWKLASRGEGCCPSVPAATWMFCSRKARTTSLAVRFRAATFSGSSQTRML